MSCYSFGKRCNALNSRYLEMIDTVLTPKKGKTAPKKRLGWWMQAAGSVVIYSSAAKVAGGEGVRARGGGLDTNMDRATKFYLAKGRFRRGRFSPPLLTAPVFR